MGKVIVFIAILAMIFVFPVLIAFRAFKSLRAKGDKKGLRTLVIGGAAGLVYLFYTAFYPTDGICKDRYERYTSLKFPRTGNIVEKEASIINDIKGSFTDCYLVEMSKKDYKKALEDITAQKKFQQHDSFLVYSSQYKKVARAVKGKIFDKVFSDGSKAYIFVGFLNDGYSVLINIVGRQSELHKLPPVINHNVVVDNGPDE